MSSSQPLAIALSIAKTLNADIFLYRGAIDRTGYQKITKLCRTTTPRRNALLLLSTYGGDAHAAYRIARALRHNYEKLFVLIPAECKSAGTLIAIGASELIICDCGELGPLDVQITKPDEMFERSSGLDVMQSLVVMQNEALETFRSYLLDIKLGSGITLKAAAEIATKLAVGLFSPIYEQIDPVKLGETQRAIAIAHAYGERLNKYDKNLSNGALGKLVSDYPSHGFVIDRKEARELFRCVRAPTDEEAKLVASLYNAKNTELDGPPMVVDIVDALSAREEKNDKTGKRNPESTSGAAGSSAGVEQVEPTGQRTGTKRNRRAKEVPAPRR